MCLQAVPVAAQRSLPMKTKLDVSVRQHWKKIRFARDKVARNHIQSRPCTQCLTFDKKKQKKNRGSWKVRSIFTHFDRSFKWWACACMSAPWGRRLSSSFLTSPAHSPNPDCHLFKFQVPTAWARDSADFSASMRTDAGPPSKCIVMAVVRCTPLSVWPLPLKAATTNSSCTPETSGAFQVGELPVSFPRQSDRPLSLLSFWGHNFFCQQCASDRRHYSLLCTIFSICQTDNSCQLPKLTMTHVWPSFEYSFTHAKDKDDNAKDERKSRFLDPKEMEWLSLWLNFVSFYLKGLIPLNNEKTPISLKCQPLQVFVVFFFEVIVINQAGSSNLIT